MNGKAAGGFTMVEILVAMLVMTIGLLGMVAMLMAVVQGNRGSADLSAATNICQKKIEELKDLEWGLLGLPPDPTNAIDLAEYGASAEAMVQEGSVQWGAGLNSQGLSQQGYFDFQKGQSGSPCSADSGTLIWTAASPNCQKDINDAGPYKYARTFVVCKGSDAGTWPAGVGTAASPPVGSVRGEFEVDCLVPSSRSQWLICTDADIASYNAADTSAAQREKKVKVLCAWRGRDGSCHSVHLETSMILF
ncbi:MAG: hypothetical protein V1495_02280 [Pseudomonadota bacterium]